MNALLQSPVCEPLAPGVAPPPAGAAAYRRALAAAGGAEVRAVSRPSVGSGLCACLYESRPYDLKVPGLSTTRLAITLTPSRVAGGLVGDRPRQFTTDRHALFLTPAGAESAWHKKDASRHIGLYFDPQRVLEGAEPGELRGLHAPIHNASVPGLRWIAANLEQELRRAEPLAAEAVDSLVRLLLARLARAAGCPPASSAALAPATLARLTDHVMAHLGRKILVAELAQLAGMPPQAFTASFVACTGTTPHAFVMDLRLRRATELLRGTTLPLAAVAIDCGFASQQHLTSTMKRCIGTTPGRYRGQAGSDDLAGPSLPPPAPASPSVELGSCR